MAHVMKQEKMWAYGLMEEVKRDAFQKAEGKEPDVQVYAAVLQMVELERLAEKEGILALDDAADEIRPELAAISILPVGIDYVTSGLNPDLMAEMLTAGYWTKKPQGMEALAFYICIRGLMEIQYTEYSAYHLEKLLTSFLTEECRKGYEIYKECDQKRLML